MSWLRRRVWLPLIGLLKQGISPDRLALCVAIGIVVGNIPILGLSTALCALIALVFRLNLAAMQLVQVLMAPTQLLLIIPYVRLGEWILRAPHQPLSIAAGLALLEHGCVMRSPFFGMRFCMPASRSCSSRRLRFFCCTAYSFRFFPVRPPRSAHARLLP